MVKQTNYPPDDDKSRATEQQLRAANQQLRAANQQLRATTEAEIEARRYAESIVDTIREPLVILDLDLRVISAGRSFYQTFKVTEEESKGQLLYEIGNRQWDIPQLRKLLEEILHKRTTVEGFEVEHDFLTIGRRTMLLNARRLLRKKGKAGMILLAIEDITERKKAEEALQAANQQLQASEQQLRAANQQLQASEQQLRAANQQLQASEQQLRAANQQLQASEQQLKAANQQLRASEQQLQASNQQLRAEVTERKKAEEALKESEQKYRTQFEEALDAIFIADAETGMLINCNRAACELIGRRKSEIIGEYQQILHPPEENEGEFSKTFKQHLKEKQGQVLETQVITKNGEIKDVAIKANVFELKGKKLLQGVFRDITERKKAEERLLDYQSQLKSLASQLTLAEEHERHRIATELHDQIGQLLIISKLNLDTVRNSGSAADIAKALNEVGRNIEQIIQNLRSLTFELSSPLLYELGLEKAVAEWLTEKIRKKHRINTEFEDDGQHKPLDDDLRALLFRDVRELLTNVVKHAQAKWVKVSIRKVESRICVTVKDDGWGFDSKEVVATATKTGKFGLFSIRERLKQLGGSIEIESAQGYGTCITLCAPLKQETENLN